MRAERQKGTETMDDNRRKFLKSSAAGVVAGGILTASAQSAFAQAQPAAKAAPAGQPGPQAVTRMTLAMLRTPEGLSLGVRTDKGIIDVGAAADAFKIDAPVSTDDIIGGDYDAAALKTVLDKAQAAG